MPMTLGMSQDEDGRPAAEGATGPPSPLAHAAAVMGMSVLLVLAVLSPPAQADHRSGDDARPATSAQPSATPAPTVINAVGRTYCWTAPRPGCNSWLSGRVTSAGAGDLGAGVAGTTVIAHAGDEPSWGRKNQTRVTTDSDGRFTAWLPRGELRVIAGDLTVAIGVTWTAYTAGSTTHAPSTARGILVPTAGYDVQPPE